MSRGTQARIDASALRHNLGVARAAVPEGQIVSVVKADAYGHGMAHALDGLAESEVLAVATVEEARRLRDLGWAGRLLLLEGFAGEDEFQAVRATGAEYVVHHASQLELLEDREDGAPPGAWLKLDTGMHRLGFPSTDAAELADRLASRTGQRPVLMTHFACADEPGHELTRTQLQRFAAATDGLSDPVSLANSGALLGEEKARRGYVRPGIMLYGLSPFPDRDGPDLGLRPAMTLSCRLLAINTVPAGETVGYGGRYRCPEDMRIGVAGIGYGDGYPRAVPDGTPVLVNGRRARVAGRVSMDLLTLDLRGHDEAAVGDEVVLWGEGLPAEEIARHAGMIPYELVCGVTGRVPRVPV